MRNGNAQLATQKHYIDNGGVRTVMPSPPPRIDDEGESLLLGILHRRWKLLIVAVIASIGVGVFCYANYEIPESVTDAAMIYSPFPSIQGATTNDPLEPVTIGEIAVSNETLRELAERNGLRVPPKRFRNFLTVKANRFSNFIRLRLNWTNGEEAIKLVNDLMELVSQKVVQVRKEYLAECRKSPELALAAVNTRIAEVKQEVFQLRKQLQQSLQEAGMQDNRSSFLAGQYMTLENQSVIM